MGTSRGWDGSRGIPVSGGSLGVPVCPFCPRGGVKGTVPPPPRCPRVPPPCPRSRPSRGRRLPLPRCLQRGGEGGAGPARSIASSPLRPPPAPPNFPGGPADAATPPGPPHTPRNPELRRGSLQRGASGRGGGAARTPVPLPWAPPRGVFFPRPPPTVLPVSPCGAAATRACAWTATGGWCSKPSSGTRCAPALKGFKIWGGGVKKGEGLAACYRRVFLGVCPPPRTQ